MFERTLARDGEGGEAGGAKIVVERAGAAVADDVERAGDWKGGDGCAARQRFDEHDPERVGARGEDEDVGAGVDARQRFAMQRAKKVCVRIALLESGAGWAVADDRDRAWQLEAQERLEVFLDRDAADAEENWPRQIERIRAAGADRARDRRRASTL